MAVQPSYFVLHKDLNSARYEQMSGLDLVLHNHVEEAALLMTVHPIFEVLKKQIHQRWSVHH